MNTMNNVGNFFVLQGSWLMKLRRLRILPSKSVPPFISYGMQNSFPRILFFTFAPAGKIYGKSNLCKSSIT